MTPENRQAAAQTAVARCLALAACTEVQGETTRLYLCDAMREVHALLRGWMEAAGMAVALDAAGNLRGLYEAADTGARQTLLIGSHLDTVPNAGAFDGVLGVVLGVAAIEALEGKRLPYAIEVLGFAEEEGVRFGKPFLGSLALVGRLDEAVLALEDRKGVSVREALTGYGLDAGALGRAAIDCERTLGYLEVHIEQGPVLEQEDARLGVVAAIAGQTRAQLRFLGQANHAGTTPMCLRHDALAAAAAWVSAVEERARATAGLVGTVGRFEVRPGAGNVIPAEVVATLDLRHPDDAVRAAAASELLARAMSEAEARGVRCEYALTLEQAAVPMHAGLTELLQRAAWQAGHSAGLMTSGAGHDAMMLAPAVPAAMLFVRSPGGVSHHPEETVRVADVEAALETMVEFLELLREDEAGLEISGEMGTQHA